MSNKKYSIDINKQSVEVSQEVYEYIKRSDWKEANKQKNRKNPHIIVKGEKIEVKCRLEESLDDLVENGQEIQDKASSFEDAVICKIMLEQAMAHLTENERRIIDGIYYANKTEREVARELGIPQCTLHYKKAKILGKLYKLLKSE